MLGDRQRETLVQFLDAIAELCAPCQDQAKIGALKEKVDVALALLERDFPLSLQVKGQIACTVPCKCKLTVSTRNSILTKRIIVHHKMAFATFPPFGTEFIQNCCFDQLGPGLQPNNVHTLYENSTKLTLKAKESHKLLFKTISRLVFDFRSVCFPELFKLY